MVRTALALIATSLGIAALAPQPAFAQAHDKVLIIYGNDKCPTSNGEEIVVCKTEPESERFRDPLRDKRSANDSKRQAENAASAGVGAAEIGSCSAVGSGGASGCFNQAVEKARAENKANGTDTAVKF